ncbi:MAG: peroxide stress protein YaaA [Bacteroidota bacterium]
MLILLSPAKTLDMSPVDVPSKEPRLLNDTKVLAGLLKKKSRAKLQHLMHISENLADLNYQRYQEFSLPLTEENAKPAIYAFRGDVYQDLEADAFTSQELAFADRQIRILSGLYGVLRPTDLMQAYRLEMGTRLKNRRGNNLYEFWGGRITKLLNEDLAEGNESLVLNLASQEYFKSVNVDKLKARLLTIHFKEKKSGKYRVVAFNAKRARGRMANLITREGITEAGPLKSLVVNDYLYDEELSTKHDWVWAKS